MGGRWSGASSSTGPMGTRIGGRRIFNPDHSSLYQSRCGVEENEVEGLRLMEVPEGSHIAFVLGRSGWYDCAISYLLIYYISSFLAH